VWETKRWAKFNEMPNGVRDIVLLLFRDGVPPILEFIGELDFPGHTNSMPFTEYQAQAPAIRGGQFPKTQKIGAPAPHRLGQAEATKIYRNRMRDGPTTVSRSFRSSSNTLSSRSRRNAMTALLPEVSGRNKTTPAC
jgi:hypothetical protein